MANDITTIAWAPNSCFIADDWEGFANAVSADSVYDEVNTGRRTSSREEHVALAREWKRAIPDAAAMVNERFVSGDTVIFDITWTGTHRGPLAMPNGQVAPATGKRLVVPAVMFCTVRDGQVARTRHFLDVLALVTQIGINAA